MRSGRRSSSSDGHEGDQQHRADEDQHGGVADPDAFSPSDLFPRNDRLSVSLQCGLRLLESFSGKSSPATLTSIAEGMRLGLSTTHRYATTLVKLGMLEQDRSRRYKLGAMSSWFGTSAMKIILLCTGADEILKRLRAQTGFTVGLGVLNGTHATYVRRYHAHGAGQYAADLEIRSGAHVALHSTALGKALLSALSPDEYAERVDEMTFAPSGPKTVTSSRRLALQVKEASETKIALSDEEAAKGVREIAACVPQEVDGRQLAIDVTVPAQRLSADRLQKEIRPLLTVAVSSIGIELPEPR